MKKLLIACLLYLTSAVTIQAQVWQYHTIPGASYDLIYADTLANKCYLVGAYGTASNPANIVSWDGHQFDMLPLCPINNITTIARYKNKLYAGGFNGLSVLNGNNWQWVDSNAIISKLYVHDENLYVAGGFTQIAQQPIGKIAVWNDTTWQSAWGADTFLHDPYIYDMTMYKGQFYICGAFENMDNTIQDLARFDGQHWTSVGPAPLYAVPQRQLLSMHVWRDTLYIGGVITESPTGYGGNGIVKWDGIQFHSLLDGLPEAGVSHIITYKDKLLCTGLVPNVNGIEITSDRGIGQWDGYQWCAIGRYGQSQFLGMGIINDTLHVFGLFYDQSGNFAGELATLVSNNYTDSCSNYDAPLSLLPGKPTSLQYSIYPNPVTDVLYISPDQTGSYTYVLRNGLGQQVDRGTIVCTGQAAAVDMVRLPQGMYSITLSNRQGKTAVHKFVKR
jgi:hypothetical protein